MDIADWLRSLGLGQYEAAFRESGIDVDILPELTDQHLTDLGVRLGHRLKMLRAIRERAAAAPPTPQPASTPAPSLPDAAERRQLTVMFCDLVGSTEIAARLDPEDLREVIGAYHRCVAKTAKRFRGFVAKYMGDGVLVYFGYPQASEDDAELAVRAALKLVAKVAELRPRPDVTLQVRLGIASGLVVVGDLLGSGASQEQAMVGDTAHLAARLQAMAEPGSVLIADSTHLLVRSLFDYRALGPVPLKGFAQPTPIWEVVGQGAYTSRFEALHAGPLTPLVGRGEEIDLLLRRWNQAKEGAGRLVLLCGEPGIGKSRIVESLLGRLAAEPHTRLRYFCSPHHRDSALHPFISQFEHVSEFAREDTAAAKRAKLHAVLSLASTPASDEALIAELLSLPTDGLPPVEAGSSQKRRQQLLQALLRQVESLAVRETVLLVFEDLQWIDATSLELLSLAVERTRALRVMVVATCRPEFSAPWLGQPHVTMVTLNRLDTREAETLVQRVAGASPLPSEVLDQIVARTDGVPLFIEELTKAVIDGGWLQKEEGRYVLAGPVPAAAIPTTLHASLVARLDRVAPVKDVAQIGAALGRQFSFELVASVTGLSERMLVQALEQLVSAELIWRRGSPPNAIYTFKHALVQDATYGTLLRGKRQELHCRIAEVLAARFTEMVEAQPEILARHYTEGGLALPAIAYWQKAGERAAKRSANLEALAHFRRGLEMLEALPDRGQHAAEELALLTALGPVLMTTRSSAAPEVSELYARARRLAQQIGRSAELYPTIWGSWMVAFVEGHIDAAAQFVDDLFAIVQEQNDPGLVMQAHHAAWPTVLAAGDIVGARRHIEAGLALYDRDKHAQQAHLYGAHDPGVCGHAQQSWVLALLGYLDQAVEQSELALRSSRTLNHPPTVVHALWHAAEFRHLLRDPQAVEALAQDLNARVAQNGTAVTIANGLMMHGWALVKRGKAEEGVAELDEGLARWRATGSRYLVPYRLGRVADALHCTGQVDKALGLVDEALGIAESTGDRWYDPELHRLRGELLPAAHHQEREAAFLRALDVSREQGAKLFELRAAVSLAEIWHAGKRHSEAHKVLATAHDWFTEGFAMPDLKAAKALLERPG